MPCVLMTLYTGIHLSEGNIDIVLLISFRSRLRFLNSAIYKNINKICS